MGFTRLALVSFASPRCTALFLLIFAAAELLLSPDALGSGLGHDVGTGEYATLA
jgi:hypothetical protein